MRNLLPPIIYSCCIPLGIYSGWRVPRHTGNRHLPGSPSSLRVDRPASIRVACGSWSRSCPIGIRISRPTSTATRYPRDEVLARVAAAADSLTIIVLNRRTPNALPPSFFPHRPRPRYTRLEPREGVQTTANFLRLPTYLPTYVGTYA